MEYQAFDEGLLGMSGNVKQAKSMLVRCVKLLLSRWRGNVLRVMLGLGLKQVIDCFLVL